MANAFSTAMNAIFADPNMAVEAIYTPAGGMAQVIRVLFRAPDDIMRFGETPILTDTQVAELRGADVDAPQEGDIVQIGSEIYQLRGEPIKDSLRLIWTVDLVPVP